MPLPIIHISADYEIGPFKFHAFVGRMGNEEKRWENEDPVQAYREMKSDLLRDGIYTGGERDWVTVMWSSSMTHLVFDSEDLRYRPGQLEVDGTIFEVEEVLERFDPTTED